MSSRKLIFSAIALLTSVAGIVHGFTPIVIIALIFSWWRLLVQKDCRLFFISITAILLFGIRYNYFLQKDTTLELTEDAEMILAVKETSWKVDGNKLEFEGSANNDKTNEKLMINYYISSEKEKQQLIEQIPLTVKVKGALTTPEPPSNFNQFNYQTYLKTKNIFCVLKASDLTVLKDNLKERPLGYVLDSFRQKLLSHIDQLMSARPSVYTKTLLFADKRTFKHEVIDAYKELGVIHLLSISGLHVSLLVSIIKRLLLKMQVSRESTATSLLLGLPVYGIVTGFGISVLRAVGQIWLKLFGEKFAFSLTTLDSWSLMLMITLIISPYSIYTISLQLSYLISFVIIVLSRQSYFLRLTKVKAYIVLNMLLLTTSIPVLSYHFYEFSWGVLVLNSLFIPVVSGLLLPLLLIALLLSFIVPRSLLFQMVLYIAEQLIRLLEMIAGEVAFKMNFNIITGRLSPGIYLLLVVTIMLLFILIEKRLTKKYFYILFIVFLLCVYSVRFSPVGQVLMIDVGQGESILIKKPWGKGNYLIDTGGQINYPVEKWEERESEFDVGKNIVLPVLKSEGVNKLESIIISHPDIDHYGGLLGIIGHLPTKQVVSSKVTFWQENFQAMFPSIESYGTIIKEVTEGSNLNLPDKTFALLSQRTINDLSKNDNSLALYGLIGGKRWLFTGDLEISGEKSLLLKYPNIKADILKVGHHGSDTSTHNVFLDQLEPEAALISSGTANRYGHPHDSVIQKLSDRGISTFRTDINGAIKYRFTDWPYAKYIDSYLFSFEYNRKQRGE
ncbi:DNA internalization-related competence protein ComEC/Rec2 [Alkalibacterium kapii]|nr:DNA internalization-related competence protein ComEC/Rec2 [Alkalibacterium kapii]